MLKLKSFATIMCLDALVHHAILCKRLLYKDWKDFFGIGYITIASIRKYRILAVVFIKLKCIFLSGNLV